MKITPDPTGQHVLIWYTKMPEDLCEPGRIVAWSHTDQVDGCEVYSKPVIAIGDQAEDARLITFVSSADQARYDAVAWQAAFWNVIEVLGDEHDEALAWALHGQARDGRSPLAAALRVVSAYRRAASAPTSGDHIGVTGSVTAALS